MEERKRLIASIMKMQEWIIEKDRQIELLTNRWENLKECCDEMLERINYFKCLSEVDRGRRFAYKHIIKRMEELEKENSHSSDN